MIASSPNCGDLKKMCPANSLSAVVYVAHTAMFSIYMSCVDDDGWGHQREKNAIRKKGFHHLGKEKVVLLRNKSEICARILFQEQ